MRDKQTIKKKYLNSRHYFWIWESTLAMNRSKKKVDFFFKSELNTKSWRRKWQPTSVFLPGESHGAWQATVHGVATVGHD